MSWSCFLGMQKRTGALKVSNHSTCLVKFLTSWSSIALSESLKADHGFNVESRAIRDLIDVMASYDAPTRRDYLQFITGSPKLPIGGQY